MKKFSLVLILLLFLTACGKNDDAKLLAEKYRSTPWVHVDAEIRVEFPDRYDVYGVTYNYERGADAVVKVTAPKTIAGIEAIIDEETAVLKFKDTILETGLDLNAPTPMSVIHKLVKLWSFSEPIQVGKEDDLLLFIFKDGEYEYQTLFTKEYVPISTEILFDSKVKMKIDFTMCEGVKYDN